MKRSLGPCTLVGSGFLLFASGCDSKPAAPVIITATPEAVILIQDTEARCIEIGKRGVERIQALPGVIPPNEIHEAGQKYLAGEAAPELAAVDKANQIVTELMPKVREESSPQVVSAIEALIRAQDWVCKGARTAAFSRYKVQDILDHSISSYMIARDKLDALYKVPEADALFARRKYDRILEEARASVPSPPADDVQVASAEDRYARERREWEESQELQARQQAEHEAAVNRWRERVEADKTRPESPALVSSAPQPGPKPEQLQPRMQTWYAAYVKKVGPVRAAFASYQEVRRGTAEEVQPACQDLLDATTALLDDPAALNPPDPSANEALKRAYAELQESAHACATGQSAEAVFRLSAYQSALRDAAAALRPYSVVP
jgi:hypothetical protein